MSMATKGVDAAQEQVWARLAALDPRAVCERAAVAYAAESCCYRVLSLGQELEVDPALRTLAGTSSLGRLMLERLGTFSRISLLHYLVHARNLPAAGRLVSPADLASAPLYAHGSHVLPTASLARNYGDDLVGFQARGQALGGTALEYGDAAVRLLPLPRVPVVLVLWRGDDEFPARCRLLLDASCEQQLAADVIWSTAMLTLLMFLPEAPLPAIRPEGGLAP
jgi:hypothetical protein